MPEYRQDFSTGRMVIVAEERASRPYQFDIERDGTSNDETNYHASCPFCEGNEALTPGEVAAFRNGDSSPDSPGWSVRTVPNLYPAVVRNVDIPTIGPEFTANDALQSSMPGFGTHEVIVDTPRHLLSIADMDDAEVEAMFRMYAIRLQALHEEQRFAAAMIFKNVGQAAGASLPHSHSQLIALPFIPESLRHEIERAQAYAAKESGGYGGVPPTPPALFRDFACPWCDRLQSEFHDRRRIIEETEHFIALCPFVSRFPAEVAVFPRRHVPYFEEQSAADLAECARLVRRMILRLEKATPWIKGRLAYNMVLQTGPLLRTEEMIYHCSLSILPSLSRAAGFEWGTGLHINPISPETAAARLRDVSL